MEKKKLWLASAVILILISQCYFVKKLLLSNRDSSTFITHIDLISDHRPAQEDQRHNSLEVHKPAAVDRADASGKVDSLEKVVSEVHKPTAVDRADASGKVDSLEKVVNGLPQRRHHHLKKPHLDLSLSADNKDGYGPEVLVETDDTLTPRPLTANEQAGNNILFTLRTTKKFHEPRLPVLFDTWLTTVNTSNIFMVTDGEDTKWKERVGSKYIIAPCRASYQRNDLCCKAGTELSMLFREDNLHYDWLCHVDDDIYVLLRPLVKQLSKFRPRKEPIYLGRSGSDWSKPRAVIYGAKYGKPGQKYHFAVGGMYCLSRAMLELAKPYLVGGKEFAKSCSKTLEPEDVTVGVVVEVVLNRSLSRTEMIYTHGLLMRDETMRIQKEMDKKIAYSYALYNWHKPGALNHISVPHALYSEQEDPSQFYSLHCFLYPSLPRCIKKAQDKYKL